MSNEIVKAKWIGDQVFLLHDHYDFPVVMTQPMGVTGADLLPLSVIGCAAWDVISILRKQKQAVRQFEVTAESQREEQAPWRFLAMQIVYRFTGVNLDEKKIRRAIELTEEKYCSTFATLRKAVELRSEYRIIEED